MGSGPAKSQLEDQSSYGEKANAIQSLFTFHSARATAAPCCVCARSNVAEILIDSGDNSFLQGWSSTACAMSDLKAE